MANTLLSGIRRWVVCDARLTVSGVPLSYGYAKENFPNSECPDRPRPEKPCCDKTPNPVNIPFGFKTLNEVDLAPQYAGGVEFRRYYSSLGYPNQLIVPVRGLGNHWRHGYERGIRTVFDYGNAAYVLRGDTTVGYFSSVVGGYVSEADSADKLTQLTDGSGNPTGWRYYDARTEDTEIYNAQGRLSTITSRNGVVQTLTYDANNLLLQVQDSFGRTLTFTYDSANRINTMTDPNGLYSFTYKAANGVLESVTGPDMKTRLYHYENTTYPLALTGITDENVWRFSRYQYDAYGKVEETKFYSYTNIEVNKRTLSYSDFYGGGASTTVTEPSGNVRVYSFQRILGVSKSTSITQTGTAPETRAFDAGNGNTLSRKDFNGNLTCYTYDNLARNLETVRIEGLPSNTVCSMALAGSFTLPARKITTEWNANWRSPRRVFEPKRLTTYTFFGDVGTTNCAPAGASTALICTKTVQETNDISGALGNGAAVLGPVRTWQWTYDSYGRVLTTIDPRNTAMANATTNVYYPNDAAQGNKRGMLYTVTNPLGHVTTFNTYDANRRPTRVTDANSLITDMTYWPRGWLKERTVGSELTKYDYDGVGQLIKLTMPDNSVINYGYDGAHRLTNISDGANISSGNRITYTLDNMGNRINEYAYDPAGVLARKSKREIDTLNRLYKTYTGADNVGFGNPTTITYDNNGNLATSTDPLMRATTNNYDALNRLKEVIDPFNGALAPTKYDYDAQDNLKKVSDPRNNAALETNYDYNGFNELTKQTSPDTGVTDFTYLAGNLDTKKDARNVTATYSFDFLNRLQTVSYPAYLLDPAETVTYTYDSCTNGKGHLCTLSDKTGTTTYSYDLNGRMTTRTQTVDGIPRSVSYSYNNVTGRLDAMTLPSSTVINYTYATNGRINAVTATMPGMATQTIASAIDYEPFGPVGEWAWGNDYATVPNKHTRYFDLDGRTRKIEPTGIVDATQFRFNIVANIDNITRFIGTTEDLSRNISYDYDALDRLKTQTPNAANTTAGSRSFMLNAIGNRNTSDSGGISPPSRRNQSLVINYGGNNRPISYSANGSTMVVGINALGQRVKKVAGGITTHFVYNEDGELVGEYDSAGINLEHVWLDGMPIAAIRTKASGAPTLFYVHADHLGTPRAVTSSVGFGSLVWTWDGNDPFGDSAPNEQPGAATGVLPFSYNLRFPGQYYDKETGLSQNYFRDYDPAGGRYIQSDPIGLSGGINTYAYVEGKPLTATDPFGLETFMCTKPLHALGGTGLRSGPDIPGNLLYHQFICVPDGKGGTSCGGQDRAKGPFGPGKPSDDKYDDNQCKKVDDNKCVEQCSLKKISDPSRPNYWLFGGGGRNGGSYNCQQWADKALRDCQSECKAKK